VVRETHDETGRMFVELSLAAGIDVVRDLGERVGHTWRTARLLGGFERLRTTIRTINIPGLLLETNQRPEAGDPLNCTHSPIRRPGSDQQAGYVTRTGRLSFIG
jgi:hypothetical protein